MACLLWCSSRVSTILQLLVLRKHGFRVFECDCGEMYRLAY